MKGRLFVNRDRALSFIACLIALNIDICIKKTKLTSTMVRQMFLMVKCKKFYRNIG